MHHAAVQASGWGKTRPFVSRSHGSFRQLRTCRNVDAREPIVQKYLRPRAITSDDKLRFLYPRRSLENLRTGAGLLLF
jgi:hypothetical protein